MQNWQPSLAKCLQLGVSDKTLLIHLDAMLVWYGKLGTQNDKFTNILVTEYGEKKLKQKFEEFLDRLVITDEKHKYLFLAELTAEQAKKRYRQLIRVFHPDRGSNEQVWLNYRAEIINLSYKNYCTGSFPNSPPKNESIDNKVSINNNDPFRKKAKRSSNGVFKIKFRPEVWRRRLGEPKQIQRKIIYGLAGLSLGVVFLFYLSTLISSV